MPLKNNSAKTLAHGRVLFFVVPRQFSQVVGQWPENQILIPDWTYFHYPAATLPTDNQIYSVPANQISPSTGTLPSPKTRFSAAYFFSGLLG